MWRSRSRVAKQDFAATRESYLFTASFLLILLVFEAVVQLPQLTTSNSTEEKPAYERLWPQHWAFFSNFADTDESVAFRVSASGVAPTLLEDRLASLQYFWGLDRVPETAAIEIGYLSSLVPPAAWQRCGAGGSMPCFNRALSRPAFVLNDAYPASGVCGNLVLGVEGPEAFASEAVGRSVVELVEVFVKCGDG